MMIDLSAFSDEKFEPKKWINNVYQSRHPQDPVDKHLADLEMKLQLLSEEITSSLEEQSNAAVLRVPRANRDVTHLRDSVVSLRSAVSEILSKLKQAEVFSAEAVASLAKIDTVKQRMEAAYKTLQDAAGLTQLSASVEDVFASGDLSQAAETLANMRHCLSVVGEVAEFANVRKQLAVLEDRLDEMVQPHLSDALLNRKVDAVQHLQQILIQIERQRSLEILYKKIHLKPVHKIWEKLEYRRGSRVSVEKGDLIQSSTYDTSSDAPAVPFVSWLPIFYDEVLLYLEQEWKWCMTALPSDYKVLVPHLLIEAMSSVSPSFVSYISFAVGDAVPETRALSNGILDVLSGDLPSGIGVQTKHLEALIELHNLTDAFARNVQHLFFESDPVVLLTALKAIYSPYEPYKQRYCQMERSILSSEIAGIDLRAAVTRGIGAQGIELSETVRRMEESVPRVIVLLEASVERCITFTGGFEVDELIATLDDIMLQYISFLQETLKSLRIVCGIGDNSYPGVPGRRKEMGPERKEGTRIVDMVSDEEEWSIVQGTLQILTVADCLRSRSSVFEASLRATLARLSTTLSLSASGMSLDHSHVTVDDVKGEMVLVDKAVWDMATLSLSSAPQKARRLFNILDQLKDPRFHALPHASQRVMLFADAVNELVYDVLISKVRLRLSEVSQLPIWSSVEEPSSHPLPSFSSYPQAYVTSVGEYLLTLPQQLEPLAEGIGSHDSNADEAQLFATEWMFKVADGAAALYIEQLRGIQHITDKGAQQLSADIEYLINVLSALSVPIPPVLATFNTCLMTPRDQLRDLVKSGGGNQLDLPTVNLICKIRHITPVQ